MRLLIIGGGGREQALGWKLKQSPQVESIYFSADLADVSQPAIIAWVKENKIDLVIVGPDQPLAEGLVDSLEAGKIKVFGPTRAAAEIEWSKSFAKQLMFEEGIPTAKFKTFTDFNEAFKYIQEQKFPLVIKADGLALGKGVIIAQDLIEAEQALRELMKDKKYGRAGEQIVIEEYLVGQEISIHAFCDGETVILFPSAQDHKRIFDHDEGPNTGGMGAITPVSWVTPKLMKEIEERIVKPTLLGLKKRGRIFKGVLYPGIMVTAEGPKVIEFNARFGDPETQVYLPLLKTDLLEIILAACNGQLKNLNIEWSNKSAACVVLASGGYPGKYEINLPITGLNEVEEEESLIFHAATKKVGDHFVTNGGRVLNVVGVGDNLTEALTKAYQKVKQISFPGMHYRTDIGKKSLN